MPSGKDKGIPKKYLLQRDGKAQHQSHVQAPKFDYKVLLTDYSTYAIIMSETGKFLNEL